MFPLQYILGALVFTVLILVPVHADPELKLNFEPGPNADFILGGFGVTGNPVVCSTDTTNPDCLIGAEEDPNATFFLNERVSTAIGGAGVGGVDVGSGYWHTVILDPANDFAMDVYTPVRRFFLSDSGGHEPVFMTLNGNLRQWSGNGWDPLEQVVKTFGRDNVSFSGNGTGNPRAVIVRQILGTGRLVAGTDKVREWVCDVGSFCQEFLKSEFDYKATITQELNDADISFYFKNDMSHLDYDSDGIAGNITITQELKGLGLPDDVRNAPGSPVVPGSIYFNYATDKNVSTVNAGQYTFAAGLGWYDDGGDSFWAYDPGSYTYAGSGESVLHRTQNWAGFYDPNQNTYSGNREKCEVLGMAACDLPAIIDW